MVTCIAAGTSALETKSDDENLTGFYGDEMNGARGRDRTTDTAIFNRMLYQLSYPGVDAIPMVRDEPSAAL